MATAQTLHTRSRIVEAVAVTAIGRQGQVAVAAMQDARSEHGEAVVGVHVAVVGQDVAGGRQGPVFRHSAYIGNGHGAVVGTGNRNGQHRRRSHRGVAVVLHRVGETVANHRVAAQGLHIGSAIVQRVAVTAVGVEGQIAIGAMQDAGGAGHVQAVAHIRVNVVGQHIAHRRQAAVFRHRARIGKGDGGVVGADHGYRQAAVGLGQAIGGRIVEAVGDLLAAAQVLHVWRAIVQRVVVTAVGRQSQVTVGAVLNAGSQHRQHIPLVDVAVVGQHIAIDRRGGVFSHVGGVGTGLRAVVAARDGHRQRSIRCFVVQGVVLHRVGEDVGDHGVAAQSLDDGSAVILIQRIAVAAVYRQGQMAIDALQDAGVGHRQVLAVVVGQIGVAVVGQHIANGLRDAVFLHRRRGVSDRDRGVVVQQRMDGRAVNSGRAALEADEFYGVGRFHAQRVAEPVLQHQGVIAVLDADDRVKVTTGQADVSRRQVATHQHAVGVATGVHNGVATTPALQHISVVARAARQGIGPGVAGEQVVACVARGVDRVDADQGQVFNVGGKCVRYVGVHSVKSRTY